MCVLHANRVESLMMIVFVTFDGNLGPLIEGLCSSNPCEFENSVLDAIEPTT